MNKKPSWWVCEELIAKSTPTNKAFKIMEKAEYIQTRTKNNKILKFIVRYNILQDGKHVETNVRTWQEALTHAEKYTSTIFSNHIVEILNVWTGEIVTIEEARKRAKALMCRH